MEQERLRQFDWTLILITLAIFAMGVLNLYSATFRETIGSGGLTYYKSQLIWFGLGTVLAAIVLASHYKLLSRYGYLIYFGNLLLLVAVLVAGKASLGGRRWIGFGGIRMQPSEFMKLAAVIAMAKYFENDRTTGGYKLRDLP